MTAWTFWGWDGAFGSGCGDVSDSLSRAPVSPSGNGMGGTWSREGLDAYTGTGSGATRSASVCCWGRGE